MNWNTAITKRLGLRYPIIQAPMFGVTTPEMAGAAAGSGCLGSLPLGDLPVEKCTEIIRTTKKLSVGSCAINLFVNQVPGVTDDLRKKYEDSRRFIEDLARRHGLEVNLPAIDEIKLTAYQDQVDVVISENCKIVSFTFGNLDEPSIRKLKNCDTVLIGTCTSVEEARILEATGIDVVCVQGLEAGGHRGSFGAENIPEIGGFSLLSQVRDTVKIPIIYAGGIYNARTLRAAKTLGAEAFQIGSLLLSSLESALRPFEKERLRKLTAGDVILTRSFSGRYARGIRNTFIEELENTPYILPYPYQNKLTSELRRVARASGDVGFVSIWVGQSMAGTRQSSVAQILQSLVTEVEKSSQD